MEANEKETPAATKEKVRAGKCGGFKCNCSTFELKEPEVKSPYMIRWVYCACKHTQMVHGMIEV